MPVNATNTPFVFTRQYIKDDCLPEGRVSIPVSLNFAGVLPQETFPVRNQLLTGVGYIFNASNIKSVYQVSGMKSLNFTMQFVGLGAGASPNQTVILPKLFIYCVDSQMLHEISPEVSDYTFTDAETINGFVEGCVNLISNTSANIFVICNYDQTNGSVYFYGNFNNFEMIPYVTTCITEISKA